MVEISQDAYSETFTALANSSNETGTVIDVDQGPKLKITDIVLAIERGSDSDVELELLVGDRKIFPETGTFDVAGDDIQIPLQFVLSVGDELTARFSNSSNTDRDLTIIAVGERVRP